MATAEQATTALQEANIFRDTHVGEGGVVPPEACAFVTILRLSDATVRFQRIFDSGTLAGQVYALCGLYLTSRPTFESLVRGFGEEESELTTQFGCIVMDYPLDELLDEVRSGELPRRFELLASEMESRGTQSNNGLNLSVRPVTVSACARPAPGHPAG